jgi:hypothetical protein
MDWTRLRQGIFYCGLAALTVSLATLVGSYVRPVRSTDYMKQFYEALPWLRWGTASAFLGFLLGFFGKRRARLFAVAGGLVLSVIWMLLGESSL